MVDPFKLTGIGLVHLLVMPEFKPGDQAPTGYLQWHEWAEVQHKAGLRQVECGRCGLWRYPQQLSEIIDNATLASSKGRVSVTAPVCNDCASAIPSPAPAVVAALYVETDGAYFGLPGVDPWDEARDARTYAGPHPVVAHPPCQRWGALGVVNFAR